MLREMLILVFPLFKPQVVNLFSIKSSGVVNLFNVTSGKLFECQVVKKFIDIHR